MMGRIVENVVAAEIGKANFDGTGFEAGMTRQETTKVTRRESIRWFIDV